MGDDVECDVGDGGQVAPKLPADFFALAFRFDGAIKQEVDVAAYARRELIGEVRAIGCGDYIEGFVEFFEAEDIEVGMRVAREMLESIEVGGSCDIAGELFFGLSVDELEVSKGGVGFEMRVESVGG